MGGKRLTKADFFSGLDWFAVVAKPGESDRAAVNLRRLGGRVFRPVALVERRRAGGVELAQRPLFERYLFVGLAGGVPPRGVPGVADVVTDAAGAPQRLSAADLAALRAVRLRLGEGDVLDLRRLEKPMRRYAAGQVVSIIDGAFAGMAGVFQRGVAGGRMARVLVDLFGRRVEAMIPAAAIG